MIDNFVFYAKWLDIIEDNYTDLETVKELIYRIVLYGIRGERNEELEKMFMQNVFSQIDSAKAKHEKRVEAGRKGGTKSKGGGAPKGNQNAKSKTTSKQQANNSKNNSINKNTIVLTNNNSVSGSRLNGEPSTQKKIERKIDKETGEVKYVYAD